MENMLSGMLTLRLHEGHKTDNADLVRILLRSIDHFCEENLFSDFIVICPPDQVDAVDRIFGQYASFPYTVVNELELIPELNNYRKLTGWANQQLLKLAASKLIKTPYFLTLDSDCFCIKPVTRDLLIRDGKGILQQANRTRSPNQPKWWATSAKILGYRNDPLKEGMSVTPVVLSTEVCTSLIDYLNRRHGNWVTYLLSFWHPFSCNFVMKRLFKFRWSEYSLYYLYMEQNNLFDRYHVFCGTEEVPQTLLSDNSYWGETVTFSEWNIEPLLSENDPALFGLVQSNQNLNPQETWEKVKMLFPE